MEMSFPRYVSPTFQMQRVFDLAEFLSSLNRMVNIKSLAEGPEFGECSVNIVTIISLYRRVDRTDTQKHHLTAWRTPSSTTSNFSPPSWLPNGDSHQIIGDLWKDWVCGQDVFLPRALASLP